MLAEARLMEATLLGSNPAATSRDHRHVVTTHRRPRPCGAAAAGPAGRRRVRSDVEGSAGQRAGHGQHEGAGEGPGAYTVPDGGDQIECRWHTGRARPLRRPTASDSGVGDGRSLPGSQAAFDICKGKEGFLTAFTNVTAIYDALDQWLDQAYHWRRASPDERLGKVAPQAGT